MNGSSKKRTLPRKSELEMNPGIRLGSHKGEPIYWAISPFLKRGIKLKWRSARPGSESSNKTE